ncbi:MAG: hypothetical protein LH615_00405, partial [Ferruginibacter sp.]|nr:hypothetical protein [Ferruginibacter sp.]
VNAVFYEEPVWEKPSALKKVHYFFLRRFNRSAKKMEAAGLKLKMDYHKFVSVKNFVTQVRYDRIIAVDIENLFYCTLMNRHADFVSLELKIGETFLPFINKRLINCVITQTEERFNYLFKGAKLKKFFIQNAPVYKEIVWPVNKSGLLYGGTAWNPFGFYHCLEYLKKYKDLALTVQGAIPDEDKKKIAEEYRILLNEKRLIINDNYFKNEEVVNYFSHFKIGICFYNFEVEWIRHFNYQSAPSGKIFKYIAAGVPVLAIDIVGFKFVEEFNCGVLIKTLTVEAIRNGIEKMLENYQLYEANTKIAAMHFSFDKAVQPYLDYVKLSE